MTYLRCTLPSSQTGMYFSGGFNHKARCLIPIIFKRPPGLYLIRPFALQNQVRTGRMSKESPRNLIRCCSAECGCQPTCRLQPWGPDSRYPGRPHERDRTPTVEGVIIQNICQKRTFWRNQTQRKWSDPLMVVHGARRLQANPRSLSSKHSPSLRP